jgi:(E)-4-hydroxy-3-methylbut-2-enyl-diphosphate synthase
MMEKPTYTVPRSRTISIGRLQMGSGHPVIIQSMANTFTLDVAACTSQFMRIADAGGQIIRFTTQGLREVGALDELIRSLPRKYAGIPVVADVHFRAEVAAEAAKICGKVRINPGNFTGKSRLQTVSAEAQFHDGYEKNRAALTNLIDICKQHNTALRIGVNHGSLSARIMSKFGDTPEGMVESAMEFLRICHEQDFHNVVVSLKSSNTVLMVHSVRLLVSRMLSENLYYPIHLGVTESGNGQEGRIKSVVGMAPLLTEGIGDTIRVSLTEPPEKEIPVAKHIVSFFEKPSELPYDPLKNLPWNPFLHRPGVFNDVLGIGGSSPPVVISSPGDHEDPAPDLIAVKKNDKLLLIKDDKEYPVSGLNGPLTDGGNFVSVTPDTDPAKAAGLKKPSVLILHAGIKDIRNIKQWLIVYFNNSGTQPVVLHKEYTDIKEEEYMIRAAGEFALFLVDRLISGIWITNPHFPSSFNNKLSFLLLQASRTRITSTEYIACPSCGRTLFDIQSVLSEVKLHTAHLKGLKIAVMGCIVNGPGEMADADYGYVGSGKGMVTIYRGMQVVEKNISSGQAVKRLIEVIKQHGDWADP